MPDNPPVTDETVCARCGRKRGQHILILERPVAGMLRRNLWVCPTSVFEPSRYPDKV